jgi:hypothetical protein
MEEQYVVGVDFGTLSGRAVVVRVSDGAELGSAVTDYPSAVIERTLPESGERLGSSWALQDPDDWREVLRKAVPAAVKDAGVEPEAVVGIATDFTASTPLPTLADGTPLCETPEFRDRPHAWPKLWKHHAAQPQADRITALAAERNEPWLARYGGMISSEWQYAKALQVLEEDAEVYDAMDRWIEGADWIVWELCGEETRNECTAGYKGIRQDDHYPSEDYLAALDERFASFPADKLEHGELAPLGGRAGSLTAEAAGVDRAARGHRGGGRQRRRPRHGARRPGDRARHDGGDHGHLDVPRDERRAAGRGAGHVRRGPRRDHARAVGLRGRPERRRRHLRLVRRPPRRPRVPRGGRAPRHLAARPPLRARGRAGGRRARARRARLGERQPLGAGRPRPQRRDRRAHARHAPARHLPRAGRGDRVRRAQDRRDVRGLRACRSTTSWSRAACSRTGS